MPIAVILVGALLIDLAFRGTEHDFAAQLGKDFGQGSQFLSWAAAILILGALGYVPALQRVSNLGVALVIVVLTLRNGGLFEQLKDVITNPPAASKAHPLSEYGSGASSSSGASGSSSSSGGAQGALGGAVQGAEAGSVAGPYGAAAGAAIGAIVGGTG